MNRISRRVRDINLHTAIIYSLFEREIPSTEIDTSRCNEILKTIKKENVRPDKCDDNYGTVTWE